MELEIRHLRAVCAIADAGSISKAATTLGISQPGLTALLQRLERELGGRLFTRGRNGAVPTRLGDFVVCRARGTLLSMDELRRGASRYPADSGEVIRLGGAMASVSVGQSRRLGAYLTGIDLRLQIEYSPQLLWELIVAGRLDAITTVDYPGYQVQPPSDLVFDVLQIEPVFIALAADHPLNKQEEIHLADLAEQRWAMTPPDGAGWPDYFLAACQEAGFTPRVPYTISGCESVRDLVVNEKVVAPCQAVFESSEGLVVRPLAGNPMAMRHVQACRRDGPLGDYTAELVRFGREAHQEYASRAPHYVAWQDRQTAARGS